MKYNKLILVTVLIISVCTVHGQSNTKCCPDTSSLISGTADYANSNVAIEKPVLSKNPTTGHYFLKAIITNKGDDCSQYTKIIVLLPAEVNVLNYSAISSSGRRFPITRCFGSLLIDVGMMCPDAAETKTYVHQIRLTVETSDHTSNTTESSFAIFAYSKTPDLMQENNYWTGKK